MVPQWHQEDLVKLIRRRYPLWDGFAHPPFVADEVDYKRQSAEKAQAWLSATAWQGLLNEQAYEELIRRLQRLGVITICSGAACRQKAT